MTQKLENVASRRSGNQGAVTQVSEDCYIVSARHVQILKEKQLPFEEVKTVVSPREKVRHLLASSIQ
jgi:hypothetical protein